MFTRIASALSCYALIALIITLPFASANPGDDGEIKFAKEGKGVIYQNAAIKVETQIQPGDGGKPANCLLLNGINFGFNFVRDSGIKKGDPDQDFSRLATTYYHPGSPIGDVLRRFNWFPGPDNTYWADARMPASLVGLAASIPGVAAIPMSDLVGIWSEPPVACVHLPWRATLGRTSISISSSRARLFGHSLCPRKESRLFSITFSTRKTVVPCSRLSTVLRARVCLKKALRDSITRSSSSHTPSASTSFARN